MQYFIYFSALVLVRVLSLAPFSVALALLSVCWVVCLLYVASNECTEEDKKPTAIVGSIFAVGVLYVTFI